MAKQALLVMDVQNAVVARYPDPAYLPRLQEAIGAARAAGIPVIYPVVGFRPGVPEVSPRNKMFGGLARNPAAAAGGPPPPPPPGRHPADPMECHAISWQGEGVRS